MARKLRDSSLDSRSARAKLAVRKKAYTVRIAPGIRLAYRRNAGPGGSWSVLRSDGSGGNWLKRFAIADDHEDADGVTVLTFWQAADRAKALARGGEDSGDDAGRPASVAEALDDYAADLAVRGANTVNASSPRNHLTATLLSRTVSMLAVRDLRQWRNGLGEAMPASTVNRVCKSLKAALTLAASHDDRITNAKAWRVGLAALPEADDTESNLVLTDAQRRDVIAAAYAISGAFGLYVEVHAATGARSGQIALVDVSDLKVGPEPRLLMPSSLKGRNRRTRTRKPVPISPGLADRLEAAAAGRAPDAPLLMLADGARWTVGAHRKPFLAAATAAGLPDGATIYCLRHTWITRALLAGVAIRLVASSADTSVAMIERTYSKYIADHGDAQMRRAVLDLDAPAVDDRNVIRMAR